jgi:hypothetical protein
MPTPTITFRVKAELQNSVRELVIKFKDDPVLIQELITYADQRKKNIILESPPISSDDKSPEKQFTPPQDSVGPFISFEAALSFLTGRLSSQLAPLALFLLKDKSDQTDSMSDFDILVIFSDEDDRKNDFFATYQPISGCGLAVNVIPSSDTKLKLDKKKNGPLTTAIETHGRLLYARPGSRFFKKEA